MENKRYLDKVIGSLVRGTKIDYEEDFISYPFSYTPPNLHFPHFPSLFYPKYFSPLKISPSSFSYYCKNMFGLTDDEIDYVWNEYITIIKDKISKREP